MNRLDRVTAILIHLQSKRVVKAREIADRFSVSLRTIYRDIKSLEEAGIPLAGEAGIGYSIMEGYRLPPVMFTREEAISFLTAEKMVEKLTDPVSASHYHSAMFKIKAVLRYDEQNLLEDLSANIEVLNDRYLPTKEGNPIHLQQILKSIAASEVLDIGYFSNHSQQYSNREIEPIGIFYLGSHWHLIAWCRLRQDYRHFRTDRISYLNLTNRHFEKQHPSLRSFLDKMSREKEMFTVVIEVDRSVIRYFGDQKFYNGFVSQQEVEDKIEMTFVTASLTGFSKFYLQFAEYATIITPMKLKEIIQESLTAIAAKLAS